MIKEGIKNTNENRLFYFRKNNNFKKFIFSYLETNCKSFKKKMNKTMRKV